MRLLLLCLTIFVLSTSSYSQVLINEIDSDTPSTDDKEFVELKTETPNFPLDGYVLVFYNGTGSQSNASYLAIDLDGYQSDANGIFLIGNALVSPVPDYIIPDNSIQNGADAVAIYIGNASDFPYLTIAHSNNLIDALAYDTSDDDAVDLMALLELTTQINENQNNQGANQSIQRNNNGTYSIANPTPGVNNDGSGFAYNKVKVTPSPSNEINEGEILALTFSTDFAPTTNLTFTYSLNNYGFNASDFSGPTTVTIPAGSTSTTISIQITDDTWDEGDETLNIVFGTLPFGYKMSNNNVYLIVIDNDFTQAAFGTPLQPTYGIVTPTTPTGYYDSLIGKSGAELKTALQQIIANPNVVRAHNYGDIITILRSADQNPLHSNQVWMMYVERGIGKYKFQTTSSNAGSWNREHIFPQSRGGFSNGTSSTPDGIDVWASTNANDIAAGHADAHHIRAEDGPENTSRSNRDYGSDYNGPVGNQGSWKGDVSRALFYMAVRYNALNLVNGNPADNIVYQMGDLASLLVWNHQDPADDFEMNRNNIIYTWQYNRNPFIDYPDLADYIFGSRQNEIWNPSMSVAESSEIRLQLYPNPSHSGFYIYGVSSADVMVYNLNGQQVYNTKIQQDERIETGLSSGMYLVKVASDKGIQHLKLVIE